MTTFKYTLRKRNIKGNLFPIIVRVIHDRKSKEKVAIDLKVQEKDWDSKQQLIKTNYPRAAFYNKKLVTQKKKIGDRIIELNESNTPFTAQEVLEVLNDAYVQKKAGDSLADYIEDYLERNPKGIKDITKKYYRTAKNQWYDLFQDLPITAVTPNHINNFRQYLSNKGKETNTIYNRLKVMRRIFKDAMKRGVISENPMNDIQIKTERSQREYLTEDEIALIEGYSPNNEAEQITKDVFLFECYTGLRISDICTLTHDEVIIESQDLRLNKRLRKTDEPISFKLSKVPRAIIEKYMESNKDGYIFPLLKSNPEDDNSNLHNEISSRTAVINKTLKVIAKNLGLKKNLSTHIGRHTFAVKAITLGGNIYVLSDVLGHTSVKTTEIYAKVVNKKRDDLMNMFDGK